MDVIARRGQNSREAEIRDKNTYTGNAVREAVRDERRSKTKEN